MLEAILKQLRDAIASIDDVKARQVAQQGLAGGVDPLIMINQGIRVGLEVMGEAFGDGKLFLPELMLAAKAADAAVAVLEPELLRRGSSQEKLGRVLMTTVRHDIHDIGKNIVCLLLKAAGFEVIDLGVDKRAEEILAAAKRHDVQVIGLSALLTTTMPQMREFVDLLKESGLKDRFKVMVGGAPVSQDFAVQIGADGYAADAAKAVELTRQLMGK